MSVEAIESSASAIEHAKDQEFQQIRLAATSDTEMETGIRACSALHSLFHFNAHIAKDIDKLQSRVNWSYRQ